MKASINLMYIKGPWTKRYNVGDGSYEVIDKNGREIIAISAYDNDAAFNEASIISAAPEMLLMLKNLIAKNGYDVKSIETLILKAEGRTLK